MNKEKRTLKTFLILSLEALGVVYGDIGTSPLYTLKVCFSEEFKIAPIKENTIGIMSLLFWSLTLIVTIKYLLFILKADNKGEGGVLALMALCKGNTKKITIVTILGLFGAGLLYGDSVITPAISVLSAVEGLEVYAKDLSHYVIPITITILILLFIFQKKGTAKVGKVFGPVMILWFLTIAGLGLKEIIKNPEIFLALNPYYGLNFFFRNGISSFLVLGGVVLSITGTEALYADVGHFGKSPIRFNWFCFVYPALLLNYFGQGALILSHPEAISNPFYNLAPKGILIPCVILATIATVIASQAVISGAFSLTRQAVQMGFLPRLQIVHTSEMERGQIYTPAINYILMAITILFVVGFKTSDNIAAAYGVAVTTTMLLSTLLFYYLTTYIWKWNPFYTLFFTTIFFMFDISFFTANLIKVERGGYIPLLIGFLVFYAMQTWKKGRTLLLEKLQESTVSWESLLNSLKSSNVAVVDGTAIFLSGNPKGVPVAFLHNFKHNKVVHQNIITMTVVTTDEPGIPKSERLEVTEIAPNIHNVTVKYGFMQTPNIKEIIDLLPSKGISVDMNKVSFFLGRETLVPGKGKHLNKIEKFIFSFLSRNAISATAFFNIPANKVVELGSLITI